MTCQGLSCRLWLVAAVWDQAEREHRLVLWDTGARETSSDRLGHTGNLTHREASTEMGLQAVVCPLGGWAGLGWSVLSDGNFTSRSPGGQSSVPVQASRCCHQFLKSAAQAELRAAPATALDLLCTWPSAAQGLEGRARCRSPSFQLGRHFLSEGD